MTPHAPLPRVLVVGGGVAALETVLALRELVPDLLRIDVLSASPDFVYRPVTVAELVRARRGLSVLVRGDRQTIGR